MTTPAESDILTKVGPGTSMGSLMRRYWIPAAKSSELISDAAPIRLMLLGEKLIAFRDTSGRVGIMDHRCPHRCASLYFGRNEANGIRCVYHGWKYDTDGNCIDMPNLPTDQEFKSKIHAKSYQVQECNGLVWVYMGDEANAPPLPGLEPVLLPETEVRIIFAQRECSWLQALEGDIDTSHFSFLHSGSIDIDDVDPDNPAKYQLSQRAPDYHVADTEWGAMYGAFRETDDPDVTYWRVAQFLFPFWTMPPDGNFDEHIITRAWVPMDDTHTMFVHISWMKNAQGIRADKDGNPLPGIKVGMDYSPTDPGWLGRWRLSANASNDYMIDREVQANGSFTGIDGIHLQDQAITESMGTITDHAHEHLAPSDRMITRTRKRLINAANELAKSNIAPPGSKNTDVYLGARGGDFLAPAGQEWEEAYLERMKASVDPTGKLKAVEKVLQKAPIQLPMRQ